ncbi:MAG TPA: SsrA-binding protein SmpB [Deltaproteobacteria bacterium]|mgnify:CR=1 FL=1|jgi:SsrA-binding protein|nr:SsrA-binding protein SmpB [Deltaproteobacteria bacterium]HOI08283.1 SsrA-binding protein SmpB [Deltaproteobacteria bacterium]
MKSEAKKILVVNKKARHSYDIIETVEAGVVLEGPEVKSLRNGGGSIKDSYAQITGTEVFINNLHIAPYTQASIFNADPERKRKLLLHKREILRLSGKIKEKGLTLVPLSIYLKGHLVKIELGLAKGRKEFRKKEVIKERDVKREVAREVKSWR